MVDRASKSNPKADSISASLALSGTKYALGTAACQVVDYFVPRQRRGDRQIDAKCERRGHPLEALFSRNTLPKILNDVLPPSFDSGLAESRRQAD